MRVAVYHDVRDLKIEELPERSPTKEAKIGVKYCGICGSDLHEYLHDCFPELFGHEASADR